jgi:hypothetical protein
MKNKIKLLGYSASSLLLLAPFAVFGDGGFAVPASGTGNLKSTSVGTLLGTILNWLLSAVGILGVIGFAISGIMYLTAAGDEKRIGTAKSFMLYAVIGVIVALIGLIAVNALSSIFISNSGSISGN